jgi:sulfur relay (sulfurtransferase) DsrF/TusC family protein
MKKLGTIDLEILHLAIKEKGTFNENNLENSELKRHGVGKILDTLASLKDRKFISLNKDGSFSITELAREILWSSNIPTWAKILRLLQIKSCNLNQIIEIIGMSEDKIIVEIEKLRKNEFLLMSPQRQENKLIKIYEILPDGINEVDKTETEGFNKIKFGEIKSNGGILEIIDEIKKDVQKISNSEIEKDNIIKKLNNLKNKLEI